MEKQFKRYLSQRVISSVRVGNTIIETLECLIEYTDGTTARVLERTVGTEINGYIFRGYPKTVTP